jgi:hypothetical protein
MSGIGGNMIWCASAMGASTEVLCWGGALDGLQLELKKLRVVLGFHPEISRVMLLWLEIGDHTSVIVALVDAMEVSVLLLWLL